MSETDYQRKLQVIINSYSGMKCLKVHGSAYMERGTPDILGCINGRMFAVETKKDLETPTAIQDTRLNQWAASGAIALVAQSGKHSPSDVVLAIMEISERGSKVNQRSYFQGILEDVSNKK